jgi:hypothetical protein
LKYSNNSVSSPEPNTPGKFIVFVLWQPLYPAGIYTHYKVSIDPVDALDSTLYVEKEGEPPGPAQAAFKGLVPGKTSIILTFVIIVIIGHECICVCVCVCVLFWKDMWASKAICTCIKLEFKIHSSILHNIKMYKYKCQTVKASDSET